MSKKIWHSHSEKPEKNGWIVEFLNIGGILGRMQLFQYNSQIDWEKHCEECRVAQWAYEEKWKKE